MKRRCVTDVDFDKILKFINHVPETKNALSNLCMGQFSYTEFTSDMDVIDPSLNSCKNTKNKSKIKKMMKETYKRMKKRRSKISKQKESSSGCVTNDTLSVIRKRFNSPRKNNFV